MKKCNQNNLLNIYFKILMLFVILIALFIGIFAYILNVRISDDTSINWGSYPVSFTTNFNKKINFNDDKPTLTDDAIDDLKKYNLSFQMIDKNGDVILRYNELEGSKHHYSPIEMVEMFRTGEINNDNYTMFVGSADNDGQEYAYIIGFPAKILKVTLYFNYIRYSNVKYILMILAIVIIIFSLIYGISLNRTLYKIISSVKSISSDNKFEPLKEKGIYRDIFHSINLLNYKLEKSEEERKKTERLREEWIANISHDLKNPLSPIRGYAEILSDSEYNIDCKEAEKYGKIILRNVKNVESLVENLNFTYKLENGKIPIDFKEGNLARLLKEIIINILNDPQYEDRNITFNSPAENIDFMFDNTLLFRAFSNLLYNCVIHNSADTMIKVRIEKKIRFI